MADMMVFRYTFKETFLHKWDQRFKLVSLFLLSISMSFYSTPAVGLVSGFMIFLFIMGKISVLRVLGELKFVMMLFIIIFLSRAYTGRPGDLLWGFIPLPSAESTVEALVIIWRFFLILLAGIFLTHTSRISRINDALFVLLKNIPFLPAARIAMMVTLTLSFVPLLLDQYRAVKEAAWSRCGDMRKGFIEKVKVRVSALMVGVIRRSHEIAMAMEARCYSENPTLPVFKATPADRLFFIASIGLTVFCYFI